MRKKDLELGVLEEEDPENDDEYRGANSNRQFQNAGDQANLFRIEQLLTRNSNFIKEP